jgi:transaldolase
MMKILAFTGKIGVDDTHESRYNRIINKTNGVKIMRNEYSVTVYDELCGGVDVLTVYAQTFQQVIDKVESDPNHQYEIIDIEKANPLDY